MATKRRRRTPPGNPGRVHRVFWTVEPYKHFNAWRIRRGTRLWGRYRRKQDAVRVATTDARIAHESTGGLHEVIVKKQNGRIEDRRTYGKDPVRSRG